MDRNLINGLPRSLFVLTASNEGYKVAFGNDFIDLAPGAKEKGHRRVTQQGEYYACIRLEKV